jgi:uncharacterized membrane protein
MIMLTLLELVTSYITEWLYGRSYWDYKTEPFNFQGRIALMPSLTWAALATISFLYLIPSLDRFFRKHITKKWQFWLIIILSVYIIVCLLLRESLFPLTYSEPSQYF